MLTYMETARKKATKSQSLITGTKSGKVHPLGHIIFYLTIRSFTHVA